MHHPPRDQRVPFWVALTLVPAFCAAPLASAEIFKCTEENGMARLQNFPCAIDSLGSLPSGPPPANTTAPGGANQTKPPAMPVAAGSGGRSANASELRIGMTKDEVTTIWGEPGEIIRDEHRKNGRIEIWRYGDTRSVQFSNKRRVLAVQR
jgi:hypothetical protein